MNEGPLAGVAVLDLAGVGPAARASGWLADYGADVVKVAPVPSRSSAQITPPRHAYAGGRGTRRLLLDLKHPAGRDTFLLLAERADVVLESFRPGVVARLGIGYDDVKGRNPRIVYCSTSGYGQTGPWARWAGHDLDYLAVSGYLHMSERGPDGKPPLPGATIADSAGGGMQAVAAILAALVQRDRTGEGAHLDVAVADGMLALMALQCDEHLATGSEPAPATAPLAGRYACYDVYRTADDGWVAVAAIEAKFWANLCRALGLDRWIDRQYDADAQDDVRADLQAAFSAGTRDEWVAALAGADTCVAPVLSVTEATAAPHFMQRGGVATARDGDRSWRQLAPLLAGAPRAATYDVPAPEHTDTDAILVAAGVSADAVARLRADGVVA